MDRSWDSEKRKKFLVYAASFLLPFIMMIWILNSIGIAYHGKLTLLTFDLLEQYMPFIMGLRYMIKDPGTLLLNWNNCLGGNYMGVFAYYMASPLNLITLFWDIKDAPDAIYVLYLVKVGLSGLTFNVFLQRKYEGEELRYSTVLFSTCYALMSFVIVDGISIMWLDAVILLPLVLLGVHRICDGRKGGLFLVSLFLVFFSNFYMSYMVGIFAFLYFCVQLILLQGKEIKYHIACLMRFGFNTLLAFGLTMPLIFPVLLNAKYSHMGRTARNVIEIRPNPGILDLLRQMLPYQYRAQSLYNKDGVPFIFCGSVFLILVPVYFLQKRRAKEKIMVFVLGMVVFSGFLFQIMDYFWHGFRNPAGFPYRYAYLFSCWMIMVGYEAFIRLRLRMGNGGIILIAIYAVLELCVTDIHILDGINKDYAYKEREEWDLHRGMYEPLVREIKKENTFYRKKDMEYYICANVDSIYGTNGTSFFSSANYNRYGTFLRLMGAERDLTGVRITMQGSTPLLESICGVKYLIGESDVLGLYTEKMNSYGIKLFENQNVINLGCLIPQAGYQKEPEFVEDVFKNQKMLLEYMGNTDREVFEKQDYEPTVTMVDDDQVEIEIRFMKQSEKETCFYLDGEISIQNADEELELYVDGELFAITGQTNTRRIFFCPNLTEGEEHIIKMVGKLTVVHEFYLYEFDKEAYKEVIARLRENQLETVSCKGNRIKGSIDSADGGLMFITLPYDEGYTVYVDGDKVQTQAALDTFLSFPVAGGQHAIEIVFVPEGLRTGLLVMLLSVLGILIYYNGLHKSKIAFILRKTHYKTQDSGDRGSHE